MLRLYLDEDSMDEDLVQALRTRGVDAMTALEAGMTGRDDRDQLIHATTEGRTLCTFNVADFYRLHSEFVVRGESHPGIILMTQTALQRRRATATAARPSSEP